MMTLIKIMITIRKAVIIMVIRLIIKRMVIIITILLMIIRRTLRPGRVRSPASSLLAS